VIDTTDRLLTPGEVAAMFRVDPKTVTRWAAAGLIASIRTPGGHRRFRESVVRRQLTGDSIVEPPRADGEGDWLVWSHEHGSWWGPGRHGYRADVRDAGRYSYAEAQECCRSRAWTHDRRPPEVFIPCPAQLDGPDAAQHIYSLISFATHAAVQARAAAKAGV
jgi:excisionase family DNA binding protein